MNQKRVKGHFKGHQCIFLVISCCMLSLYRNAVAAAATSSLIWTDKAAASSSGNPFFCRASGQMDCNWSRQAWISDCRPGRFTSQAKRVLTWLLMRPAQNSLKMVLKYAYIILSNALFRIGRSNRECRAEIRRVCFCLRCQVSCLQTQAWMRKHQKCQHARSAYHSMQSPAPGPRCLSLPAWLC